MGTSERQNVWLAVPPAVEMKHVVYVPGGEAATHSAQEGATMPPKTGEMEGLLDACGRTPSATLRLAVPDSLSAMVAAIRHTESGDVASLIDATLAAGPRAASAATASTVSDPAALKLTARLRPPPASAKAQLGIGTARISRPRRREDWKIWSAPVAACAVLGFALIHAGAHGGSAQAAAPSHVVANVAAASQPAADPATHASPAAEVPAAPPQAAVGISFRRAARAETPAAAAAPSGAAVPAGRSIELAREAARKGDDEGASALYAKAIGAGDQPCEAWTERAALEQHAGRTAIAVQMYTNALAANSRYVPALLGRADANWAGGTKDEATKEYGEIVATVSSDLYPKRVAERAGVPAFQAPVGAADSEGH